MSLLGSVYVVYQSHADSLEDRVLTIFQDCDKDLARQECYNDTVLALYPDYSIPELLEIIKMLRRTDPYYSNCHALAHDIASRAIKDDPASWRDLIAHDSGTICTGGFVHGVVIERFRGELSSDDDVARIMPDLADACARRERRGPSLVDWTACIHGIGHLLMYVTENDVNRSLALCGILASLENENARLACMRGVFMQMYWSAEEDNPVFVDNTQVTLTSDSYRDVCAVFENDEVEARCLVEAYRLFFEKVIDGDGVGAFCGGFPGEEEEELCYGYVASIIARHYIRTRSAIGNACDKFPAGWRVTCYEHAAASYVTEDRNGGAFALSLCAHRGVEVEDKCERYLSEYATDLFGATVPEKVAFCELLPEDLRSSCNEEEPRDVGQGLR